jgi:glyoxylase-like metal-dependent hydrolase (beta-lactamase superfamily II)
MKINILPNLWQVGGGDLTAPGDAAIYLARFGDRAVLVDAGCGNAHAQLVSNISQCLSESFPIEYLLLTHCHFDHTGGAEAVRKTYGCKIIAHALDAPYLESGDSEVTAASWYGARMNPLGIDIKIENEPHTIEIGDGKMMAHHWPGHSPGSLVYTTKMDGQVVLFGQDVHGPLHPSLLSNPADYQMSLKKIFDLDADILLEGHFGIYRGKEAVRRFIRSFMDY